MCGLERQKLCNYFHLACFISRSFHASFVVHFSFIPCFICRSFLAHSMLHLSFISRLFHASFVVHFSLVPCFISRSFLVRSGRASFLVRSIKCPVVKRSFASNLSTSKRSHISLLFTNEEQKRLARDVFNTMSFCYTCWLVHDVIVDTDCGQAQWLSLLQMSIFNEADEQCV